MCCGLSPNAYLLQDLIMLTHTVYYTKAAFFGHRPKRFWNVWKKFSHFGQNVWKYRLMNIVMVSLTQLWHKWPKCFRDQNVSAKKNSMKQPWNICETSTKRHFISYCCKVFAVRKAPDFTNRNEMFAMDVSTPTLRMLRIENNRRRIKASATVPHVTVTMTRSTKGRDNKRPTCGEHQLQLLFKVFSPHSNTTWFQRNWRTHNLTKTANGFWSTNTYRLRIEAMYSCQVHGTHAQQTICGKRGRDMRRNDWDHWQWSEDLQPRYF